MYKHWSLMDMQEKLACLTDLRGVVAEIPVRKLNMGYYMVGDPVIKATQDVDDLTLDEYHACGTAFCVAGWVAPIKRFGVAFNIGLDSYKDSSVDSNLKPICMDDCVDPSFKHWSNYDYLSVIFDGNTESDPHTEENKQEVLDRIDTQIAMLKRRNARTWP